MALIEDAAFLEYVKVYAADEQLFFTDFAEAFSKLIAVGCPAHVQPGATTTEKTAEIDLNRDFRDLAMHGSVERMEELFGDTIDINSTEALSGRTALHKAAYFGHAHVIDYLVGKSSALVNAIDADGDTALHDAARFGHVAVVEALLKAGADSSLVNNDGKTAAVLAKANEKDIAGLE
jgi:ankyrin repeat protein